MTEEKKVSINGMAIASALGSILSGGDERANSFVRDFFHHAELNRVFAAPSSERPDPNEIFPTDLIRWPVAKD